MNKIPRLFVVLAAGCEYASVNVYFAPCLKDYKLLNVIYYGNAQCAR